MKHKTIFGLLFIMLFSLQTVIAQTKEQPKVPVYPVYGTIDFWNQTLQALDLSKIDPEIRVAVRNEITNQVNAIVFKQQQEAAKKDSTAKKTEKPKEPIKKEK